MMKYCLCLTCFLSALLAVAAAAERPNILVIMVDDLGYGDLGVHGGKDVPTPHIDALAASGIRCTSGYVSAPYCSPSRAGLLTGRCQTRFGHEFNPHQGDETRLGLPLDQRTIADQLHAAGYATGIIGKWHQGFSPNHHPQSRGFDEFFGFLVGAHNFLLDKNAEPRFGSAQSLNLIYRGRERQAQGGYATDLFTDEALAFIDRHAESRWFLYLAYNAVHTPLEILPKYGDRVPALVTNPARRGYLSLLIGLDDCIGRLTAHLKKSGRDRDTLVFFLSDNGGSGKRPFFAFNTGVNTPLRGDKGQMLEGGIRVPYFVSWPGRLTAGRAYDHPVSALDIFPTACAAGEVDSTASLDGVNLLPHLTGDKDAPPHDSLYWRFGSQRAIRQGKWKLVDWRDFEQQTSSGWQLYDLSRDIGEQRDLAVAQPQLALQLRQSWEQWDAQNIAPLWHGTPNEDPTAPAQAAKKK